MDTSSYVGPIIFVASWGSFVFAFLTWSDHELLDALVPRRLVASAARGRDDAERADANLQANRRALALLHEVQA